MYLDEETTEDNSSSSNSSSSSTTNIFSIYGIRLLCFNLFPILGEILSRFIHIKILICLGLSLVAFGNYIFLFKVFSTSLGAALQGAGAGLIYFRITILWWDFFPPKKKGLVNGFLFGFFSLNFCLSNFFNSQTNTTLKIIFFALTVILSIVSVLLISQPNEKNNEGDLGFISEGNDLNLQDSIFSVFKEKKIYFLFGFLFSLTSYGINLFITKSEFVKIAEVNGNTLIIESIIFSFTCLLGGVLWGFFFDKFGYFYICVTACSVQIICAAAFYPACIFSNKIGYLIISSISAVSISAEGMLFPSMIRNFYGLKKGGALLGIVSLFITISVISGIFYCHLIIKLISKLGYLCIFLISAFLAIISLGFLFCIENRNKSPTEDSFYENELADTPLIDDEGINSQRISLQKLKE